MTMKQLRTYILKILITILFAVSFSFISCSNGITDEKCENSGENISYDEYSSSRSVTSTGYVHGH